MPVLIGKWGNCVRTTGRWNCLAIVLLLDCGNELVPLTKGRTWWTNDSWMGPFIPKFYFFSLYIIDYTLQSERGELLLLLMMSERASERLRVDLYVRT